MTDDSAKLAAFFGNPAAFTEPRWLDELGRTAPTRAAAAMVQLRKPAGASWISVRIDLEDLGPLRATFPELNRLP